MERGCGVRSVITDRVDRLEPSADLWSEALRRVEAVPSRREPAPRPLSPLRRLVWVGVAVILLGTGGLLTAHALSVDGSRPSAVTAPTRTGPRSGDALTQPPLPIGRDPYGGPHDPSSAVSSLPELVAELPYAPILPDSPLANNGLFTKAWIDRFHRAAVYYGRSRVLVMLGGGGLDFTGLGRFLHRIQNRVAIVFPASSDPRYPATLRMMFGDQLVTVAGYLPTRELAAIARTLRPVVNLSPEAGSPVR